MAPKKFKNVEPMWTPKPNSGLSMKKFKDIIEKKYDTKFDGYWSLHQWTVENFPELWKEMWDYAGIIHSKPYEKVVDRKATCEDMPKWFEGARLNYAENLLRYRDDHIAMILTGEERQTTRVTFSQLYDEVRNYSAAFRKCGVKKGDRIACCMSNREEPIYAMLAATSIGAIWSGALPFLGAKALLSSFKMIKPKMLLTMDRFVHDGVEREMLKKVEEMAHDLPSLEKIIIVQTESKTTKEEFSAIKNSCSLDDFLDLGRNDDGSIPELEFEQLSFNHPVCISYTSGTTGAPKALIHGVGILLARARDVFVHGNATREAVTLSTSPVGWATWNLHLSALYVGATLVVFEGVPYWLSPTYLWDIVDEFKISKLFLSPYILDELQKKHYIPTIKNHLNSLRSVVTGSSIVKPQHYDFVYENIKPGIFRAGYGSTEIMGICLVQEPTLPVYRGEISAPALGVDVCCYDETGNPVIGEVGELVIRTPSPSHPLGLWGDDDGCKFKEIYFSKFKGVFAPRDICLINPLTKGIIVYGRSDETLNPKGARFGSSEIYNVVATFEEIRDSLCISQYKSDGEERVVLFIKMKEGQKYDEGLVQKLMKAIERELSEDHVPEIILEVQDIPRHISGTVNFETERLSRGILLPFSVQHEWEKNGNSCEEDRQQTAVRS